MRLKIIPIGTSQGVRLPRRLLEALRFGDEADLEVRAGCLTLRPRGRERLGWEGRFLGGGGIARRAFAEPYGRTCPRRWEVHAVEEGPPVLVVSPDEMNRGLPWVLGAPVVADGRDWPTRVPVTVPGVTGFAALEEIGRVDGARLEGRHGTVDLSTSGAVLHVLARILGL